jgi:hypothetical protein
MKRILSSVIVLAAVLLGCWVAGAGMDEIAWHAAARSGDRDELCAYLNHRPHGRHAPEARAKITQMSHEASH